MLLSDVVSQPVECEGSRVGFVIDVRLVLRGAANPGGLATPQVVGLVVGPRRGVAFLGYERTDVVGPALVNRLLARRQRGSFLVDLADVERVGETVVLRPGCTRWSARLVE